MSPPGFVAAAIMMISLAMAHSILGEKFILKRLFKRDLPKLFGDDSFTKQTLRFAWHALTVAWWAIAALLLLAPADAGPVIGWTVVVGLGTTALMTIIISRGRHLSWVVELAAIGALVFELV